MPAASVQLLIAALPQPCSIERVRFGADVEPPDRLLCIAYPLRTSGRDNPSALPVWWLVCRKVLASFVSSSTSRLPLLLFIHFSSWAVSTLNGFVSFCIFFFC